MTSIFFFTTSILLFHLLPHKDVELEELLFGSLDKITSLSFFALGLVVIFVLGTFFLLWQAFMLFLVHEETASVEGLFPKYLKLLLFFCVTLTVSVSLPFSGALPLNAILMLPAFFVAPRARSVQGALVGTALYSFSLTILGATLAASLQLPLGASVAFILAIPLILGVFFKFSFLFRKDLDRYCFRRFFLLDFKTKKRLPYSM